jgi:hypothetical protein
MSVTVAGTLICDYIFYRELSIDHSSIFNLYGTSQITQSITMNTYTKYGSVLSHINIG